MGVVNITELTLHVMSHVHVPRLCNYVTNVDKALTMSCVVNIILLM